MGGVYRSKGASAIRKLSAFILIVVIALPQFALGWGREGHQIIAMVAEDRLDETTKVMLQSLLGNNHLYSVAAWADDIRRDRRETAPWHYVNIPLGSEYDANRDCPPPKSCVVKKIEEYKKVLVDRNASREERGEALKFLVHFVGDVHQPLHSVKEAAGGNGIQIRYTSTMRPCPGYGCTKSVETTLHGLWDMFPQIQMGMPQHISSTDELRFAKNLEQVISENKLDSFSGGSPEQWANESVKLAKAAWVQDGASLDERYYDAEIKVVDTQMALAGLRLAKLLNDTLGKMTPRDFVASSEASMGVPRTNEPHQSAAVQSDASTAKVWVNTRSGVYHCPTSEYYGKTKQGEFMTEADAKKNGYRPVGGKMCE